MYDITLRPCQPPKRPINQTTLTRHRTLLNLQRDLEDEICPTDLNVEEFNKTRGIACRIHSFCGVESRFNAPYMHFTSVKPNWRVLYECLSSPFTNTFTQYLERKQKEREMQRNYREGTSFVGKRSSVITFRIAQAVRTIFVELERKGMMESYTEDKVIKMLKKAMKLKGDPRYKERVLSDPTTSKARQLLAFMKDARDSLRKMRYLSAETSKDNEMEELEEALGILAESGPAAANTHRAVPQAEKPARKRAVSALDVLDALAENELLDPDACSLRDIRCRSCACRACGGAKYYQRVGKKLPPLAARKGKKRSTRKCVLEYTPSRSKRL